MPPKPDIPYNPVPTVAAQEQAPNDLLHVEATPAAFGGQIGEAEQRAGGILRDSGSQVMDLALKFQQMHNETVTNDALTQFGSHLGQAEMDLHSQKGLNAVNGFGAFQKTLTDKMNEIAGTITSPQAKLSFQTAAAKNLEYTMRSAGGYVGSQADAANIASYQGQLKTTRDLATLHYNDPQQLGDAINDTVTHSLVIAHTMYGEDPKMAPAANALVTQHIGDLLHSVITATAQQGDTVLQQQQSLQKATELYHQYLDKPVPGAPPGVPMIDAAHQDQIGNMLQSRAWTLQARQREEETRSIPILAKSEARKYIGGPNPGTGSPGAPPFTPIGSKVEKGDIPDVPSEPYSGPGLKYGGGTPDNPRAAPFPSEQVGAAIQGTEWHGQGPSPTSVNGAVGNWQVLPSTFAQYARPGEKIDNPADNAAVGQRIVDDLYHKYGGDPQRVAVGYFSGPGNVAPPGSPTPWIRDAVDGNGQSTSNYVATVANRLGVQSRAGMKMDEATALAMIDRDYSGNPQLGRAVANEVRSQYAVVNMGLAAQEKAAKDQVAATTDGYVKKMLDPATPPIALSGMVKDIANDPAYQNDPEARWKLYEHVRQRMDDISTGKMANDGAGFWPAYQRLFLPAGDPNRISDAGQVYNLAGPDAGGVSLQGAQKLNGVLQAMTKPENAATEQWKKRVFDAVHGDLTHADDMLHMKDPKGEQLFLQWFAQANTAYQDGVAAGKTPAQMLTPSSKDYIGATAEGFKRPMAVWMKDRLEASDPVAALAGQPTPEVDLSTAQGLAAAYRAGKVDPVQAEKIARDKGWIKAAAPAPEMIAPPVP